MDKAKKVFNCEIKQVGEESERILRFVGSDETPDRDEDIIEATGWKCDDYMKNPVFLWAHNYSMPPIGKAVKVEKDLSSKALVFDIKFPTLEELSSDIKNPSEHARFVDTVYNLYKGGYLSATSVGFRGLKFKARDDDETNSKPEWQRGRRYMEQALLELSAVPVPSNPNALQQAKSAGLDIEAVEKAFELKEVELLVDSEAKEVYIFEDGQKTAKVKIADEYLEKLLEPLEKSGATVSAKNRELLAAIHAGFDGSTKKLKDFLDAVMPIDPDDMPMMTAERTAPAETVKLEMSDELKQALDEIKNQVSLLLSKDAPKVIDLDAIEFPKAKEVPADIELQIEPGELKKLIQEAIQNSIQGGN